MPLSVNLRHLEAQNIELKGELPVEELDLGAEDEMVQPNGPLLYAIEVQQMEHSLLLQGNLRLPMKCQCVRCLKEFACNLELRGWTRLLPLEGEEKAEVVNDCVDLTPYVREDILLEFPQHPLCEAECRGLPKREPGTGKQPGDANQSERKSSAWTELDKLKL